MWAFRAMNTEIAVAAPGLDDRAERALVRSVEWLFRDTERRFSRFDPDSELARLNRAERPVTVSPALMSLLIRARAHARTTGGVFEPAIGGAMQAAGYDRSFAPGALDHDDAPSRAPPARIDLVELDLAHRRVHRPPHVQLDLGGFLKGLTADRAAALAHGPVVIDAGGDAVLRGAPPGSAGWTVEVEDPHDADRTLGTLEVRDRAVATSAANRRRWQRGGHAMHHLIDPRTGAPARTDVVQATVLAATAEEADVMAKVAFVLGSASAIRELDRRRLAGVLVLHGGAIRTVGAVELHHA